MGNKAAIVGFGELGEQIKEFLKSCTEPYTEIIYFDDAKFEINSINAFPFNNYINDDFKDFDFFVAIGYKHLIEKQKVIKNLIALNRSLPSFVHISSFKSKTSILGQASFIYPMCNIDKKTSIGEGVILNNSVTVSHDNIIGAGSYLSPGVVTCGYVEIGENCFIGAGSVISSHIKIGKNVTIGIGSVVTTNVPDNVSAIGNPAVIKDKPLNIN
jgi:sugar O-acyltransferase (sialic acid O-acetyltransferase NeuD family)